MPIFVKEIEAVRGCLTAEVFNSIEED